MSALHTDGPAESYYTASANPSPSRVALNGDVRCDVCVIGAGITGTSAALHLAEQGYNVVVLESQRVGWGASGRSGGQALIGYNKGFRSIAARVGRDDARALWDLGLQAKDLLADTVAKHDIECDLKWGYLMMAIKPRQVRELAVLKREMETETGYEGLSLLDQTEARDRVGSETYLGALSDSGSGHLHPLNYTLGLARAAEDAGAVIYETTLATHIQDAAAPLITTPNGSVRCKHVILCANAYVEKLVPSIAQKIIPSSSFIIATEPLGDDLARSVMRDDDCAIDLNHVLNYWRLSADKRLLFGGQARQALGTSMRAIYPQLKDKRIDYAWGGNVALTINQLPHFGRVGTNMYFAHGFSGHGILLAGLAGKLMAQAVQGTAESFDVFARIPHMSLPGGPLMRTPALALSKMYFKLRDLL